MSEIESTRVPDTEEAALEIPSEPLSLQVLQVVKAAQLQQGLRHEDYDRYRKYCARRLRRLYKAHKLTHGRGKYCKRALDVKHVTDSGHLMVLLVLAERAWAEGMQLKSKMDTGDSGANRHRQRSIRRLAKAVLWADTLAAAAGAKGRPRTALEAAAYADSLAGTFLVDRSRWHSAVARLERAQAILQVLKKVGTLEEQELAHQKLNEVDQQLRFARYEGERKGSGKDAEPQAMEEDTQPESSWQELARQLEEEGEAGVSTSAEQPSGPAFISWRGQSFPVRANRVRASLQVALQAESELDAVGGEGAAPSSSAAQDAFERCNSAYNEAKSFIRHALNTAPGGKEADGEVTTEARALNVAVTGRQLERVIQRAAQQLAAAEARLPPRISLRPPPSSREVSAQASRPEEVVRLCDTLGNRLRELGEVATQLGGASGERLLDFCAAKGALYKALRCFYVAHTYLAAGRAREAYAVFERAAERSREARARVEDCAPPDAEALALIDVLEERSLAWTTIAHVEVIAEEQRETADAEERLKALQITDSDAPEKAYLMDNLDEWASFMGQDGQRLLCAVPPRPSPLPVRPFLLDAALSYVQEPNLDHRTGQDQAQTTFGKLASFWRK